MSTLLEELTALKTSEDKITGNKVANFAYDDYAYEHDDANGVDTYNVNNHQNIPNGTANILKVNPTILTKGWRAQASAITRMLIDHFLGRCSYNLNKINDHFSTLLAKLISFIGEPNGLATLDGNGKVALLNNVTNTGDSDTPTENGTSKFTTGGAYILQQAINGKAPTNHATSDTIYGLATFNLYGHVKKIANIFVEPTLTSSTVFPTLSGYADFDYALVNNFGSSDISRTFYFPPFGVPKIVLISITATAINRLVIQGVDEGSRIAISVPFYANSTSIIFYDSSREGLASLVAGE